MADYSKLVIGVRVIANYGCHLFEMVPMFPEFFLVVLISHVVVSSLLHLYLQEFEDHRKTIPSHPWVWQPYSIRDAYYLLSTSAESCSYTSCSFNSGWYRKSTEVDSTIVFGE
jgi:hypothetical protein